MFFLSHSHIHKKEVAADCGNVEKSNSFLDFSWYCGKVWENPDAFPGFFHDFPMIMEKFRQILESFIKALHLSHVSFIDNGELDQLCLPSKKRAQRLAGIDLNKARCRHVLKSVLELSTKYGGFNSKDLADKYVPIAQISEQNYKSRHASYDLRKYYLKSIRFISPSGIRSWIFANCMESRLNYVKHVSR